MASTGVILAVLQLFFALTWVIYVIYLPGLAAQAGIPKDAVPLILLMDQAIFVACDWAAGVYADRVAATLGRIGPRLAMVTLVSCAAFLALPFVAPEGSVPAFIALTVVWSATSSALRAPPLMLIGKHAASPHRPWLAGLYMLGIGIAGAMAPYLGSTLKGVDPRIPFAISSIVVVVVTFVLAAAERRLEGSTSTLREREWRFRQPGGFTIGAFAIAVALLAVGFQVHFSMNSVPAYLKHAKPQDLEHLMPVFWIGFNLLMLPATLLTKRFGGLFVMALAGVVAVAATAFAARVDNLDALIAAQFVAGGAWGTLLMSAFTAALAVGNPGRGGSVTGMLFSVLALAAFARIAFVNAGGPSLPGLAEVLPVVPAVLWAAGTLVIAGLAFRIGRSSAA
ncbi:MFS transporter [Usitatibacter palustris]|uniref:Major Facilitator Superfamily protein n=1 Tax=Usitatibacter palustris TaxID=2732487 RepID=A0A6M4HBH6_9PROT|nr:MFS transporter [Usitatibacter palustris]QJR16592.1 hypothetical protein DSM104440_03427 [Usitatibacter palustris]